jgi:hypothetical protein
MSDIWQRVTKADPCPVCEKGDWCQVGDFVVKCMRVQSDKPCPSGGWYHKREGVTSQAPPPRVREPDQPLVNCGAMIRVWAKTTFMFQYEQEAKRLGVLKEALIAMRACWSTMHNAWAFPMCDGWGEVIGIRLRSIDGKKWAVAGSRQGIFLPGVKPVEPVAYLVEGPTDCAAALSIGLFPIGRPSCNCGADHIKVALKKHEIKRVVIVGEPDKIDTQTGRRPGIAGAMKLKAELKVPSVFWVPPAKDMRELVRFGATKVVVESMTKDLLRRAV